MGTEEVNPRDHTQINKAIDNLEEKIYKLRSEVAAVKFVYSLVLGLESRKINKSEAQRLYERVNPEVDPELLDTLSSNMLGSSGNAQSIVQMIEELEQERW